MLFRLLPLLILIVMMNACDSAKSDQVTADSNTETQVDQNAGMDVSNQDPNTDPVNDPNTDPMGDPIDDPIDDPTDDPIDDPINTDPPEDCTTHEDFFIEKVWRPVIKPFCLDCHNPQGAAQNTDMIYVPEEQLNSAETNYQVFSDIASLDRDGQAIVLLKPSNQITHGGGALFDVDSDEYKALEEMVRRSREVEEVICDDDRVEEDSIFQGVHLLGPQETLRRSMLTLAGRLPSADQEDMVTQYGWGGVETALNQAMRTESFYTRLKEIWNDILLTDKYLGRTNAIDLLSIQYYPQARWFIDGDGVDRQGDQYWSAVDFANNSLAREVLEHITYIVRNDRPFSEIITSDYIAMNPMTARLYGVTDIEWDDPLDPKEFKPGRIPNIPHAGILTSPMFLNRYPTTDTNRNRHRARIFYKLFLDLNVFKLAERPIDPTSTAHNPTMNDPQCSICHTVVDPVAGSFQHWDQQGSFNFREAWYGDMRAPGLGQEELPFEERTQSLRWLAQQTVANPKFARSMTRLMYEALIGQALLSAPVDGVFLEERQSSFDEQQRFVDALATGFQANQYDIRWLLKRLVQSPYFRAQNVSESERETMEDARLVQLSHLGLTLPLTPEQLHRKLYVTTGLRWRPNATQPDYLLDANAYRILYGGIDSDDVVERIRTPNGIFANIQRRMANEVACKAVAYDFTKPVAERHLFPWVEIGYIPEDINAFPIPQAQELIKKNLQYLAWRLWGQRWEVDHPEIQALFNVFVDVWRLGNTAMDEERLSRNLHWGCQGRWDQQSGADLPEERRVTGDGNYVVRTWQAMITLFLNDYQFLYE